MSITTVIYHSADFDGIFCREIAKKFLGNEGVEYTGWNFGDDPISTEEIMGRDVIIMDLPTDKPFGYPMPLIHIPRGSLTWIDHHKSSIESHPTDIPGYRIDGVAACRLAWQWFSLASQSWKVGDGATPPIPNKGFYFLPEKQDFLDRKVSEPIAVRLAGEYDVWDKRDERADFLQYALRAFDPDWSAILEPDMHIEKYLQSGEAARNYVRTIDSGNMKSSFLREWEGLKFLCLNGRGNSPTFASRDTPETGHDALLMFFFQGKQWVVSLYHSAHRKDLDLSEIAKKHGGGGHRGACGFTCETLPFTL